MPAHEGGVARLPVRIEVGESIAARENLVGEGQFSEEYQRQRQQSQRREGSEWATSQEDCSG
jgi:hypothetical protein